MPSLKSDEHDVHRLDALLWNGDHADQSFGCSTKQKPHDYQRRDPPNSLSPCGVLRQDPPHLQYRFRVAGAPVPRSDDLLGSSAFEVRTRVRYDQIGSARGVSGLVIGDDRVVNDFLSDRQVLESENDGIVR
jgi:hypothetical protein